MRFCQSYGRCRTIRPARLAGGTAEILLRARQRLPETAALDDPAARDPRDVAVTNEPHTLLTLRNGLGTVRRIVYWDAFFMIFRLPSALRALFDLPAWRL